MQLDIEPIRDSWQSGIAQCKHGNLCVGVNFAGFFFFFAILHLLQRFPPCRNFTISQVWMHISHFGKFQKRITSLWHNLKCTPKTKITKFTVNDCILMFDLQSWEGRPVDCRWRRGSGHWGTSSSPGTGFPCHVPPTIAATINHIK